MNVELQVIPQAQKALLHNLMEKYMHDFSEYDGEDVDEQGLYGYKWSDQYFIDADRYPMVIRADGKIAGLVLVRRGSGFDEDPAHSLAEFFVMRKYRRKGVGTRAARLAFEQFPGKWEVSQDPDNPDSILFWHRVVGKLTNGNFEQIINGDGEPAQVFTYP
jgi:predicted acetyltransferase